MTGVVKPPLLVEGGVVGREGGVDVVVRFDAPDGVKALEPRRGRFQRDAARKRQEFHAASIGEGLLAAYAVTGDGRYRRAAVAAGDFLLGVAEPADGGLRWPDWADPDGRRSTTHFTSFDDGAAGISDYLWRLYRVTHAQRFREASLAGMRWVVLVPGILEYGIAHSCGMMAAGQVPFDFSVTLNPDIACTWAGIPIDVLEQWRAESHSSAA